MISFLSAQSLPGLRDVRNFDVPPRSGPLMGWKVSVRADALVFRSPPGWKLGGAAATNKLGVPGEDVTTFRVPRHQVAESWTWADGEEPGEVETWDDSMPEFRRVAIAPVEHNPAPPGGRSAEPGGPSFARFHVSTADVERAMPSEIQRKEAEVNKALVDMQIEAARIAAERAQTAHIGGPVTVTATMEPVARKKPGPKPKQAEPSKPLPRERVVVDGSPGKQGA
jgi:hypothetical protein